MKLNVTAARKLSVNELETLRTLLVRFDKYTKHGTEVTDSGTEQEGEEAPFEEQIIEICKKFK